MTVEEIKDAIRVLSSKEIEELLQWLEAYDEDAWDRQIQADVAAGRFEPVLERVRKQYASGECRPL